MAAYFFHIVFGLIALAAAILGCRFAFLQDACARKRWALAIIFIPVSLGVACSVSLMVLVFRESESEVLYGVFMTVLGGLPLTLLLAAWGWAGTYLVRQLIGVIRQRR